MADSGSSIYENETDLEKRLFRIEDKLNLVLEQQKSMQEQQQSTQKAIAHIRADFRELVREAVKSAIRRHHVEGYSKIAGGI